MRTDTASPIRLADYRPPDWLIDTVELDILLHPAETSVRARLHMRPNPAGRPQAPLVLDGDGLAPLSVCLDGVALDLVQVATADSLTIAEPPQRPFVLETEVVVNPTANTQLMGLYRTGSAYCTQCEAEGFRRITYFLDRPDVLSVYTVRMEAETAEAAVLLSNGNPVEAGAVAGTSRHFAVWHDPHPKPAYLYALVAGNLAPLRDRFTTMSGKEVALAIYVEAGKERAAVYAMDALKRSMRWDEQRFGREYDLDVFNIVAVSDFNIGAMENKGLNIFNDKYVLALPDTASDGDYARIETIIAHEYFHNWTGNRITCRDWFQLSLKEGLTVFRDQEFTSDERSRPVKRIADARALRADQFAEDAGPLAHSVRPEIYSEINNFYTSTVYEKGCELIRMLQLLIGADAFSHGMELYFARYDGTAATVEDFIGCFAESSSRDLGQFMRWYSQAGTPVVMARTEFDAAARTLSLDLSQSIPATPGQTTKLPMVIPIALGLVSPTGGDLPLATGNEHGATQEEIARGVFELSTAARRIVFHGVTQRPALSLMRGFSAPVRVDVDQSAHDLQTLLKHDGDSFNRWWAAQTYAMRLLLAAVEAVRAGQAPQADAEFLAAFASLLDGRDAPTGLPVDPAFIALAVTLPSEGDVSQEIGRDVDPDAVHAAREWLWADLGRKLQPRLLHLYAALDTDAPFRPDAAGAGRRSLRNTMLDLIAAGDAETGARLAAGQLRRANNMTDEIAALSVASSIPGDAREEAIAGFYAAHRSDALVIDKWFAIQAMIPEAATIERVEALMRHPAYDAANPNRIRALVGSFANGNPTQFNRADGAGFELVTGVVTQLDAINPQVAARLLSAFNSWRRLESRRRAKAEAALSAVAAAPNLSRDTRDIVTRSLAT